MRNRRSAALLMLLAAASPLPALAAQRAAEVTPAFDAVVAETKRAMMADPAQALGRARAAEALVAGVPGDRQPLARATARWLEGEALFRINRPDQALPLLESADALARATAPGSRLQADIMLSRGQTEVALGKVTEALGDLQHAYALYGRLGEPRGEAKSLLEIGGLYSDAGDDQRTLQYYSEVPDIYRGDPAVDLAARNNLGEVLKRLARYGQAESQYRLALKAARQLGSPLLEVRILTNIASAQLLDHRLGDAQASALAALRLAQSGEAAGWRPFISGVLAQIAYARGNVAAAKTLLDQTFRGVDLATSPASFRDFHATAVAVYEKAGALPLALQHLRAVKRLDDEAQHLTASSSAALAGARFDFARQDLRIAKLKSERVRQAAQFETSRARLRATILAVLLAAGAVVVVLLLGAFLSLRRSRNEVRAANASLQEANSSLESALKVKTEFLATTSHEIRTPLNGILGMTQVLLADGRIEDSVRERLGIVHSAGETMRALVDDLLDVAKMETGHLEVERADVGLSALLNDAARLWRDQAEARGLRLELDLAACPDRIMGDEARLRQIVFNLMSNAFKFTEAGGVWLRAAAESADGGETLVIAVRDSGIGIRADKQELIFESFRQADGGTTRKFGGTGLGLAICRNLALAMGGTIGVVSQPGEGATFTLRLPLERVAAVALPNESAAPARSPAATLAHAHALVVDANPLTRRILAKLLKPAVADLAEAGSVAEAVAMAADLAPDLLLIDAACLQEDAGQLAALGSAARLCLLRAPNAVLTADALLAASADRVLDKPIGSAALVEALSAFWPAPALPEPAAAA